MIIVKKPTRHWARLGMVATLGGLVAAASAVPVEVAPSSYQGFAQPVKERESTDPRNISNDRIEISQNVAGTAAKVEGVISSQGDVDFYRIDVPAGHTLNVGIDGADSDHELRLYQYVADRAGMMIMSTFLPKPETARTWTYKELGSAATHEGTLSNFAPRNITLTRNTDEYAPFGRRNSSVYRLDRLSSAFYVKVQNKTGAASPAGGYVLNLIVSSDAKKPI